MSWTQEYELIPTSNPNLLHSSPERPRPSKPRHMSSPPNPLLKESPQKLSSETPSQIILERSEWTIKIKWTMAWQCQEEYHCTWSPGQAQGKATKTRNRRRRKPPFERRSGSSNPPTVRTAPTAEAQRPPIETRWTHRFVSNRRGSRNNLNLMWCRMMKHRSLPRGELFWWSNQIAYLSTSCYLNKKPKRPKTSCSAPRPWKGLSQR